MIISSFWSYVIKDFNFYFGTRVISFNSPNNLNRIVAVVSQVLALECPSKSAISKMADYFIVSNFVAYLVLKMASVLIFSPLLSFGPFDIFARVNWGSLRWLFPRVWPLLLVISVWPPIVFVSAIRVVGFPPWLLVLIPPIVSSVVEVTVWVRVLAAAVVFGTVIPFVGLLVPALVLRLFVSVVPVGVRPCAVIAVVSAPFIVSTWGRKSSIRPWSSITIFYAISFWKLHLLSIIGVPVVVIWPLIIVFSISSVISIPVLPLITASVIWLSVWWIFH
jgi:hypothetical protein